MKPPSPENLLGIAVLLFFMGLIAIVYVGLMDEKQVDYSNGIPLDYIPPHE